jgi:hypothetical protein
MPPHTFRGSQVTGEEERRASLLALNDHAVIKQGAVARVLGPRSHFGNTRQIVAQARTRPGHAPQLYLARLCRSAPLGRPNS